MPCGDSLNIALDLAACGLLVFPLHSPVFETGRLVGCSCDRGPDCGNDTGKHPRIKGYCQEATKSPAVIERWWRRWPDANVAVLTGERAGIIVIDIDPRNGGGDTMNELEARQGPLPHTPEVLTGGGGRHLYFIHPGVTLKSRSDAFGPGVDLKADGNNGYVVGAGSLHASGRIYMWELSSHIADVPLAALPQGWLALVMGDAARPGNMGQTGQTGRTGAHRPSPPEHALTPASDVHNADFVATDVGVGATPVFPAQPSPPRRPNTPCLPYRPCLPCGIPLTLEHVIERTLPTGPGEHDSATLALARGLKLNVGMDFSGAEDVFERWFERARPSISNQDYEFAQDKFVRAWDMALVPLSSGTIEAVFEFAKMVPVPEEAKRVRSLSARRLVPIVVAASALRSDPFPLSCHEVARALVSEGRECDPKDVHRWLHMDLVRAGILECVDRGRPGLAGKGAAKWRLLIPFALPNGAGGTGAQTGGPAQ
ncbi:MAG: bifunctional DNA primase/polymerase [Phycisphaerales bacterium]